MKLLLTSLLFVQPFRLLLGVLESAFARIVDDISDFSDQ